MKIKRMDFVILLLATLAWGCNAYIRHAEENSTPVAMQTNGKAAAHNDDQKTVMKKALPHTDPTGKGFIELAIEIGDKTAQALSDNAAAITNLNTEIVSRDRVIGDRDATILNQTARYKVLENSWGVKLQRKVEFWSRVIFWWLVITFACRIIGAVLPPPYGTVLAIIGTVLWPFGWIHSLADNAHFRGWTGGLRDVAGGLWSKVF